MVDTTPPTTPGTPTASAVTSTTANLAWTASTDAGGSGLAGYNVYRRVGTTDTLFVQTTTNSAALTGLTASTAYSFVVRARDGAGNLSAVSGAVNFTTQPPPVDTTPPTTPGTPTASSVTPTSANLAWTASTDAGGSGLAGYNVYQRVGTTDTLFVQTTTNSAALTGLSPGTAYSFVVRARDGAGNLSTASGAVNFTTVVSDTTPPTTPGTPTASAVTSTTANLAWTASTDAGGSGLAGYNVYRRVGTTDTLFVQTTTNSAALTGLTASTAYSFVVRARDGAGNLSAVSGAVNFTTTGGGGGGCTATYTKTNEWNTGFGGEVRVTNNGTTATSSWTVTLTFPNGQVITQLWGGLVTQTGAVATVTPESWNAVIPAAGSTTFGFNAELERRLTTTPPPPAPEPRRRTALSLDLGSVSGPIGPQNIQDRCG